MPRLSTLEEVLFDVEEHPVFVEIGEEGSRKRLAVPDKKAIVNTATDRVLGVVGRDYRTVTNQQALDWGYRCAVEAFPHTKPDQWNARKVDAPESGAHCFIDLRHTRAELDFKFLPRGNTPESFTPFVRVANSYNARRALSFNIGYLRKVCSNGLILPRSVIRFGFSHSRKEIGEEITFLVAKDSLEALKIDFLESLKTLSDCELPRACVPSLFRKILLLRGPDEGATNASLAEWEELRTHVDELCERACEEAGENAYALFNALTEFASHPPQNRFLRRERHALQRLAGSWTDQFVQECRQPGFSPEEYLSAGAGAVEKRYPSESR